MVDMIMIGPTIATKMPKETQGGLSMNLPTK